MGLGEFGHSPLCAESKEIADVIPVNAVLRSFRDPSVVETLARLDAMHLLDHILVVINTRADTCNTARLVSELELATAVTCIKIRDQYGWSIALNRALDEMGPKDCHVLCVSNEVVLTEGQLRMMSRVASKSNASCGYSLFRGRSELPYQVPRNTCCLWPRLLFEQVGYFDESLDHAHGMEDYDLALRAFDTAGKLPYLGARDVILLRRTTSATEKKTAAELSAIEGIRKRYSASVLRTVDSHLERQASSAQ